MLSFDRQDPNSMLTSTVPNPGLQIDESMFDDGVELSDLANNYREMLQSLEAFKEQKQALKSLRIGDETEQVNLQLIKMQVLDMAERFDQIENT